MLARRAQFHQQNLVSHLTPLDPAYNSMLRSTADMLVSKGADSAEAMHQAQGLLYGMVVRHSMMQAFIDDFWLLGVTFLAVIPLIFLMKSVGAHKAEPAAIH